MRALIQRVKSANVKVDGEIISEIQNGLLVFLGVTHEDGLKEAEWLSSKIINLRIFNDDEGKMNLSVQDYKGDLLIVSQFTLYANSIKGNRPSYIEAARPEEANNLYEKFIELTKQKFENKVFSGKFGADMKVGLLNDGPVTIFIDTKDKK